MLLYLAIALGAAAWRFIPRPWDPTAVVDTAHHRIYSTATHAQTEQTARTLELLYDAYSDRLGALVGFESRHPLMQLKLFKDRREFRRIHPGVGWAEAFYKEPYCRAYYSADESNPYHWILHESVHQLNNEVANLSLEKWLEEGLALYFSTSRVLANELAVGDIDPDSYPVWWIDKIATATELSDNLRNGSVIPLRVVVTNRGGPSLNSHVNLYYLHWWTLTHFIFEHPHYREKSVELVQQGGDLTTLERLLGPIERVQAEWHGHVRDLKADLAGSHRRPSPREGQ